MIPGPRSRFVEFDEKIYCSKPVLFCFVHYPDVSEIVCPPINRILAFENESSLREEDPRKLLERIRIQGMQFDHRLDVGIFSRHYAEIPALLSCRHERRIEDHRLDAPCRERELPAVCLLYLRPERFNIEAVFRSRDPFVEPTLVIGWIQFYPPGAVKLYNVLDDLMLIIACGDNSVIEC